MHESSRTFGIVAHVRISLAILAFASQGSRVLPSKGTRQLFFRRIAYCRRKAYVHGEYSVVIYPLE